MTTPLLDSAGFFRISRRRMSRTAESVDRMLRERAERNITVFVSDTSGFTRKTDQYGIDQFLSVMTRHYTKLRQVFRKHRATLLSQIAENICGSCVNVGSKLGEDLAGKGEIPVTGSVAQRVKGRFRGAYDRTAVIGGRPFELYRVTH